MQAGVCGVCAAQMPCQQEAWERTAVCVWHAGVSAGIHTVYWQTDFFFWWRRKRQWEVKKEEGSPTVISQNGRGEKQHISSTPVYTYNWLSFPLRV